MDYNVNIPIYKIIIVGDSGVGKSSILNTYIEKKPILNRKITIGSQYSEQFMKNYKIKLNIWDCAGQERYHSITKLYFRGSKAAIFVFDLSNLKSLTNIVNYWIKTVIENTNVIDNVKFVLVGNKSDISINTDYKIIWDLCKKYNMIYIESSVVNNKNISDIFNKVSEMLVNSDIQLNTESSFIDIEIEPIPKNNNIFQWC